MTESTTSPLRRFAISAGILLAAALLFVGIAAVANGAGLFLFVLLLIAAGVAVGIAIARAVIRGSTRVAVRTAAEERARQ